MADQDIELDLETGEEIRHKAPEPPANPPKKGKR